MLGKKYSSKVEHHADLCKEINDLYARKNHDYGDSFHQTFTEEGLAMARIRLGDKVQPLQNAQSGHGEKGHGREYQGHSARSRQLRTHDGAGNGDRTWRVNMKC